MKKIPSIIIVVWGIAVLCTLFLSSCKRPEVLDNSTLVNSARNVALTFGPAYVPYFKEANVSDVQVFKKEDYGDSRPQIRKQIGRKFYTVTFTSIISVLTPRFLKLAAIRRCSSVLPFSLPILIPFSTPFSSA